MLLGYGEDALTLWAITKGLPSLLRQLEDDTPEKDVLVLFRPSFGRRSPNPKAMPSVFGEFDAIMRSKSANYLIEGKWNKSSELSKSTLDVEDRQQKRHEVMHWYYDNWQRNPKESWANFRKRSKTFFETTFPGRTMPTAGTTLARNLEYVLDLMKDTELPLYDVLLFSTVHSGLQPSAINPSYFRLVVMNVEPVGGDGFIMID